MWYNKDTEREVKPMKNGKNFWVVMSELNSIQYVEKSFADKKEADNYAICLKALNPDRDFWVVCRNLPKWLDI